MYVCMLGRSFFFFYMRIKRPGLFIDIIDRPDHLAIIIYFGT